MLFYFFWYSQGEPQVNITESAAGVERFVESYDCTGHKKDILFISDLVEKHIIRNVGLVMAEGACGGMLKVIEQRHPR